MSTSEISIPGQNDLKYKFPNEKGKFWDVPKSRTSLINYGALKMQTSTLKYDFLSKAHLFIFYRGKYKMYPIKIQFILIKYNFSTYLENYMRGKENELNSWNNSQAENIICLNAWFRARNFIIIK